jgi:uncharacterized membrane protein
LSKPEQGWVELWLASALLASALLAGACASRREPNASARAPALAADATPSCSASPVTLADARPLVAKHCLACHSPSGAAADYDFRSDGALTAHRRNIEAKLRLRAMPPPGVPQPNDVDRSTLRCWAKG